MSKESNDRIIAGGLAVLSLATGAYAIDKKPNSFPSEPSVSRVSPGVNNSEEVYSSKLVSEVYSPSQESKVSSVEPKKVSIPETKSEVSSVTEPVSSQVVSSKPEEITSSTPEVYFPSVEVGELENVTVIEYGKSELGRPLEVMLIKPTKEVKKTVLLTFEIHGFEGSYPRDGQVLVDLGNELVKYFSQNPDKLGNTALYVVPSANPDGLIDGNTDNGFGRCQASGIDINRDFDYRWKKETSSLYKTLSPFSSPESRALRDLVVDIKPNDVIDFHGWFSTSYGNTELCEIFNRLGVRRSNCLGTPGYWTSYAKKYCERVALIELRDPKSSPTDPQKLIEAVTYLCAE
ncbi:MAG TPA: M14 family zinc carboxypeptidase [Candidatus Woesebacteria bacterium]|nr:M14 family zinc carboxypeptidase [Candidatus Woesebacteria bacterium]